MEELVNKKEAPGAFWGKISYLLIINVIILIAAQANLSAEEIVYEDKNLSSSSVEGTAVLVQTTDSVAYNSYFYKNPAHLILTFQPYVLSSQLKENIPVNSGMVKNIYCRYYKGPRRGPRWVKSLTFAMFAPTLYQIKQDENFIRIFIQNSPENLLNTVFKDEVIVKDYMPKGYSSVKRRDAISSALRSVRVKRQLIASMRANNRRNASPDSSINEVSPAVLVEKKSDNAVSITAVNLSPFQMITTGVKVLLASGMQGQGVSQNNKVASLDRAIPRVASVGNRPFSGANLNKDYAVIFIIIAAIVSIAGTYFYRNLIGNKAKKLNEDTINTTSTSVASKQALSEVPAIKEDGLKIENKSIEELFLKDFELQSWPKDAQPLDSSYMPPIPDIAERRRYIRADVRNSRGILNRALVGSKTQTFKNIRINDISKGGLSFLVKSKETIFKIPTVVKLYFADSTKPIDLWIRVVWERDSQDADGKNVGARFTKVPKESWDKISEAFGHRLA